MELYSEISVDGTSVLHTRIGALHDHITCIDCNLAGYPLQSSINLAKCPSLVSIIANFKSLGVSVYRGQEQKPSNSSVHMIMAMYTIHTLIHLSMCCGGSVTLL